MRHTLCGSIQFYLASLLASDLAKVSVVGLKVSYRCVEAAVCA